MQDKQITSRVFGPGIDSTNRLEFMLEHLQDASFDVFWETFQTVWPTCDGTWMSHSLVLEQLREHQPAVDFLRGEDREFYESLPHVIEVYRGCNRSRVHGLSWTTDPAVAASFARGHRRIPTPQPVVVKTLVAKSIVLTVSTGRGECEVILDSEELPDDLSQHLWDLRTWEARSPCGWKG